MNWRKKGTAWMATVIGVATFASAIGGGQAAASSIYENLANGDRIRTAFDYETPEQPTVYLTFDDGPSALTEQVLDILEEEKVPATFFVLGELAEQRPDVVKRMAESGHAVGNHTYDHDYEELYGSFDAFWAQVRKTDDVLTSAIGSPSRLLRAPGGTYNHFDAFYFYFLEQAGYRIFDWNVDAGDSKRKNVPKQEILDNVKKTPLKHEMNVLLHDGANHEATVEALPEIIRYYRNLGYRFEALGERVKPIQFSLKTPKHRGTYGESDFYDMLATVSAANHAFLADAGTALRESAAALELKEKGDARPAPGYVSVRDWAESRGGKVVWDQKTKSATVYLYFNAYRFSAQAYMTVDQKLYVPESELNERFPFLFAMHSMNGSKS